MGRFQATLSLSLSLSLSLFLFFSFSFFFSLSLTLILSMRLLAPSYLLFFAASREDTDNHSKGSKSSHCPKNKHGLSNAQGHQAMRDKALKISG